VLDQTNDTVEYFKSDSIRTALIEFTDGDDAITIADGGAVSTSGNLSVGGSNNELRFYEGANYVGFEAPALAADKIWVLPTADGTSGQALVTDGSGTLSWGSVFGKQTMWIPSAAMYPSTTNPCSDLTQVETTALRPDLKVLDFATGADEFAQFSIAFPKSWNEGTITFQPFWTVTGTNTGTVAWQLGGIAVSNDDSINTAFGTLVATTALAFSGSSNDLMMSAESSAVTIGGSPAANDMCFFQINRDISADDQTGDARLLGIKLFFTNDATNDA
jgi:hypothetical protein